MKAVNSKIEEGQLRWHGHVKRLEDTDVTRRLYAIRSVKRGPKVAQNV